MSKTRGDYGRLVLDGTDDEIIDELLSKDAEIERLKRDENKHERECSTLESEIERLRGEKQAHDEWVEEVFDPIAATVDDQEKEITTLRSRLERAVDYLESMDRAPWDLIAKLRGGEG